MGPLRGGTPSVAVGTLVRALAQGMALVHQLKQTGARPIPLLMSLLVRVALKELETGASVQISLATDPAGQQYA